MQGTLSYRHRVISDADLIFIRGLVAQNPQCSRRRLSEKLCQAWNWVQPNGALRDMVCRSMMLMLHRQGLIELPPVRQVARSSLTGGGQRDKPAAVVIDQTPLSISLAELGPLEIRQVRRTPEEALFNSLLQQHHYLGYSQPVGEHLKYLVFARGRPIACVAWSSAPPMATSKSPTCGHPNSSRQDEQIIGALRVSCRGDVDGVGPAFFDFPMNGCLASAARQAGGVGRGAVGRQRTP